MDKNHHSVESVEQVDAISSPKTGALYEVSAFDRMNAKVDSLY